MDTTYKTTKADYAVFTKACEQFVKKFCLGRWSRSYEHVSLREGRTAQIGFNIAGRSCIFSLAKEWDHKPSNTEIRMSAVHEVTHLLTCRLLHFATERFVNEEEIMEEYEAIARSLENVFYGGTCIHR